MLEISGRPLHRRPAAKRLALRSAPIGSDLKERTKSSFDGLGVLTLTFPDSEDLPA